MNGLGSELTDIYLRSVSCSGALGCHFYFPFKILGINTIYYHFMILVYNSSGAAVTFTLADYYNLPTQTDLQSCNIPANSGMFIRLLLQQISANVNQISIITAEYSTNKATWTAMTSASTMINKKTISAGQFAIHFGFKFSAGSVTLGFYSLFLSYTFPSPTSMSIYGDTTTCTVDSDCIEGYMCETSTGKCQGNLITLF